MRNHQELRRLLSQSPMLRGMLSYAIIWPSSSIIQQYIEHGAIAEHVDLPRAARFSIFGAFFMAPLFHNWMKFSSKFFRNKSLKTAVTRAACEQVFYAPFAVAYFFFGMGVIEMKPVSDCVDDVRSNFRETFTTGMMFWPLAQTLNFYFISERNRLVFVSAASFIWTVFLAHVKDKNKSMMWPTPEEQSKFPETPP